MISNHIDCKECMYVDDDPAAYKYECSVTGKGISKAIDIPEACPFNYREHNTKILNNPMR